MLQKQVERWNERKKMVQTSDLEMNLIDALVSCRAKPWVKLNEKPTSTAIFKT